MAAMVRCSRLTLLFAAVLLVGGCHRLLGFEAGEAGRRDLSATERSAVLTDLVPATDLTAADRTARDLALTDLARPPDLTPTDVVTCPAGSTVVTVESLHLPDCWTVGQVVGWTHLSPCCTATTPCLLVVSVAAFDAGALDTAVVSANGNPMQGVIAPPGGRVATGLWYAPLKAGSATISVKAGASGGTLVTSSAAYLRGGPVVEGNSNSGMMASILTKLSLTSGGLAVSAVATELATPPTPNSGTTTFWARGLASCSGDPGSGSAVVGHTPGLGSLTSISWSLGAGTSASFAWLALPVAP